MKIVTLAAATLIIAACGETSKTDITEPNIANTTHAAPRIIAMGELISYKDIPAAYYVDIETNRKLDPYDALVQTFRDRKQKDLANPDAPKAFSVEDHNLPTEFQSAQVPWNELADVFTFDWGALNRVSPAEVAQLRKTVKVKIVFDHPDLKIVELAVGSSALLPAHSQAAPSVYHILEGTADITVDGETKQVFTGTSIKLDSYAERRIRVTSGEPLKVLWLSWAPGGQQEYLNYGYYLTGSNFHAQPVEAVMPDNFQHWQDSARRRYVSADQRAKPNAGRDNGFYTKQSGLLEDIRSANPEALNRYPATPVFSNELDVEWLDFTKISGGFFWAKDAAKGADLMKSWNKIVRMKGIFQAKVPNEQYDLNFSYIAIGPHGKYVTHSHATPEFYYVLGGETEWIIDGDTFTASAGDVYFHSPYQDHEMKGLKTGQPMRAITGSWAPFGDRSVFEQDFLLTESLPVQPESAVLSEQFNFHDFELKRDLVFKNMGE